MSRLWQLRAAGRPDSPGVYRAGERSSQLSTCLAACEVYLLDRLEAEALIEAQVDVIRTQWAEAADAARLTELDRQLLYGRELLNEFAFRD
jgi:serine/threonine-protein kinase HipA